MTRDPAAPPMIVSKQLSPRLLQGLAFLGIVALVAFHYYE